MELVLQLEIGNVSQAFLFYVLRKITEMAHPQTKADRWSNKSTNESWSCGKIDMK
jgi:hypothetical protein